MSVFENKVSTRVAAWDVLKLLAIFLVIYGHCMQHLLEVDGKNNPLFLWITSFHMPLFMALSGLFARKAFQLRFNEYLLKRGRQLLLPCVSWSIIILMVVGVLGEWTSLSIKSFAIDSLWFLKSAFVCGILGFWALRPHKNRIVWVFFTLLLSQMCWVWNVFMMYPCFLLGMCIFSYLSWIVKHKRTILFISGLCFFSCSLYLSFTPDFWILNKGIRAMLFSGVYSLQESLGIIIEVMLKRYIQLFVGLCGSLFFIVLFYICFSQLHNGLFKIFANWGQYTLGIYVIQTVVLEIVLAKFVSFSSSYLAIFDGFIAPVISIIVLCICLYINMLILSKGGVMATILLGIKYTKKFDSYKKR